MARPAMRPAEAAPRWSVLLALTGLVLALHLLLLTDGLTIWWSNKAAPQPTTPGLSAPPEASTEVAAATPAPDAVLPVTSSTVRWIVPKPPAPEPPTATPPGTGPSGPCSRRRGRGPDRPARGAAGRPAGPGAPHGGR